MEGRWIRGLSFVASVLVILSASRRCHGENIPPGVYCGTYHIDRWQQSRLAFFFVDPVLRDKLSKYAGRPVEIDAQVEQVVNPGSAMIRGFKRITEVEAPVQMTIEWVKPEGGAASLRRINAGQSVEVKITARNTSAHDIDLSGQNLKLYMRERLPSLGLGNFFSHHEYYELHEGDRKDINNLRVRSLWANDEIYLLRGDDETIDLRSGRSRDFTAGRSRQAPVLKRGKTYSWNVMLTSIPANEFEIAAALDLGRLRPTRGGNPFDNDVVSPDLRLDAVDVRPRGLPDLSLALQLNEQRMSKHKDFVAAKVTFTNSAAKSLYFGLAKDDDGFRMNPDLNCFDQQGTLLPLPANRVRAEIEWFTLEAGKQLQIDVLIPSHTALARVAWYYRFIPREVPMGAESLETGFRLSPHLIVER